MPSPFGDFKSSPKVLTPLPDRYLGLLPKTVPAATIPRYVYMDERGEPISDGAEAEAYFARRRAPRPYLPTLLAAPQPQARPLGYQGVQAHYQAPQQSNGGSAFGPAAAFMWPLRAYNAIANAYNQMEQQGILPRQQQAQQGQGYAPAYDVPRGVDPQWWGQFAQEHDGQTPEQVYRRDGEYAVAHALADKAWGEQFYRTYGRPPSDYDWKASYSQRQRSFYGG